MDIIPLPNLKIAFDIDGFSTSDFNAIYVDQFVYEQRYHRFRFTLTHELGHKVMILRMLLKLALMLLENNKMVGQAPPYKL